jgi:hypothetical protein
MFQYFFTVSHWLLFSVLQSSNLSLADKYHGNIQIILPNILTGMYANPELWVTMLGLFYWHVAAEKPSFPPSTVALSKNCYVWKKLFAWDAGLVTCLYLACPTYDNTQRKLMRLGLFKNENKVNQCRYGACEMLQLAIWVTLLSLGEVSFVILSLNFGCHR